MLHLRNVIKRYVAILDTGTQVPQRACAINFGWLV